MAYSVSFGIITKKENSTSNAASWSVTADCLLKEPCDILNPTVTYQGSFPENANYMYIPAFNGRYYWITNIVFTFGHWEISGKCDELASYKEEIGNTVAFVTRSASHHREDVLDTLTPALTQPTQQFTDFQVGFSATGAVILCVSGMGNNQYFAISTSTWQQLSSQLFSSAFINANLSPWESVVQQVTNTVLSPGDYISSATWIPAGIGTSGSAITLGFYSTGLSGNPISPNNPVLTFSTEIDIPLHPQIADHAYLQSNTFCRYAVTLPAAGTIALDADVINAGNHTLYINMSMDADGGITYLGVYGNKTFTLSGSAGMPLGYGDTKRNVGGLAVGVGQAAAGVFTGNPIATASGVISAVSAAQPATSVLSTGGTSTIANVQPLGHLECIFYRQMFPDNASQGRPYATTTAINALSGYVQCSGASVSCNGTQTEIAVINAFLNGGFYYE